eukprot:SAG22_NODE_4564_length_1232_cov_1.211827_1_plen_281_part_01
MDLSKFGPAARPRRKTVAHQADRYPLTGQRVEIGGGAVVGTIVEYLSENIALLRHDEPAALSPPAAAAAAAANCRSEFSLRTRAAKVDERPKPRPKPKLSNLSLEARPFKVLYGEDLLAQLHAAAPAQHDGIARHWFPRAPAAPLDVHDGDFADRINRLLKEGYAPLAVNATGEPLLGPAERSCLVEVAIISERKGRGYRAVRNIPRGTVILREKGMQVKGGTGQNAEALAAAILLECRRAAGSGTPHVWADLCGGSDKSLSTQTVSDSFVPILVGTEGTG